ncbi:hypothetical protein [Defluviicoccus vanus]|uniref:DUF1134 domain-containing protein n=1 Tax=Defluviicoccus vanus TaxID=111831 RepID=A0A7H1N4Q1_9PROT|nr:hypothetical protein [Defluviicoccus vanus]QNT70687.1 hypothetical protein HQ394_16855 [Defluviicoccus vanus]
MREKEPIRTSAGIRTAVAAACLTALLTACSSGGGTSASGEPPSFQGLPPSGYVDMQEVQVAYIGSAGGGTGTLTFQGQTYPFTVGGLGVGGIGISSIDAKGEVYKLTSVANFPGAYGQGRYGIAVGTASAGDLWLENPNGVVMHLKAKREGLMLSLGGDAVVITMQ